MAQELAKAYVILMVIFFTIGIFVVMFIGVLLGDHGRERAINYGHH